MIFESYIPEPPVGVFVDQIIYFESYNAPYLIERFLPDGNTEVIVDLRDDPQFIYDNETLEEIQTCRRGWASGVRTSPISIPAGNDAAMLVVTFKKGLAHPFFPLPMNEIRDSVVDAELIWGDKFERFRERLLTASSVPERFQMAQDFLESVLNPDSKMNTCVDYAVNGILRGPHTASLSEIREEIGYSRKHFIELFKKRVGVTPKAYLRIMRFQKAVNEIESGGNINWPAIALECGFYDQAHFINEFRGFSGFTPNTYLNQKNGNLNYVPVR